MNLQSGSYSISSNYPIRNQRQRLGYQFLEYNWNDCRTNKGSYESKDWLNSNWPRWDFMLTERFKIR